MNDRLRPVHSRTAGILVIAVAAAIAPSLSAQKFGREILTLTDVLDRAKELAPQLPRAGLLPGETTVVWQVQEMPGRVEVVDRVDLRTRGTTRLFNGMTLRIALRAAGSTIPDDGAVPPFSFLEADRVRVETEDGVWAWRFGTVKAERILPPLPRATATTFGRPGVAPGTSVTASPFALSQSATKAAIGASPRPPFTSPGFTESIATSWEVSVVASSRELSGWRAISSTDTPPDLPSVPAARTGISVVAAGCSG